MEPLLFILGIALLIALSIIAYLANRGKDVPNKAKGSKKQFMPPEAATSKEHDVSDSSDNTNPYADEKTRALLIETLNKMGGKICDNDEDEGWIAYDYQGHRFLFYSADDSLFITVCYPWWYEIPLDNIDQLVIMRKVINEVNHFEHCSVFYTIDEEDGVAGLHSKKSLVFVSKLAALDHYLQSIFLDCLNGERRFFAAMEKEKAKEEIKV